MVDVRAAFRHSKFGPARSCIAMLAAICLAGCDHFPQDPERTLEQVQESRVLRVGIEGQPPPEATRLLHQIEAVTGARARISEGGVEPLLAKLDKGEIDLVIARFGRETPWAAEAALSPPLHIDGSGETATEWRAAMRGGENRWIMLVETRARRVSAVPDAS
jgi:hypothetical protein